MSIKEFKVYPWICHSNTTTPEGCQHGVSLLPWKNLWFEKP